MAPKDPRADSSDLSRLQHSAREIDRWQSAQQHTLSGRHLHAIAAYQELLRRFPGVAQLWFELAIAAAGELDFTLAADALRSAAKIAQDDVTLLILIGQQFHRLRRLDEARECFQGAVAADPSSVSARVSLADWYERERRLDLSSATIEACRAAHPRDEQARYFRAFLMHRAGRQVEAETALRDLIGSGLHDPNVKVSSRHLLGVVLDERGEYGEAMQWLLAAKQELRRFRDPSPLEREYEKAKVSRRQSAEGLTQAMLKKWREAQKTDSDGRILALLGGHPRSGTTLVEQVLGAHPRVLAFDESEAFVNEIANRLAPPLSAKPLTAQSLDAAAPSDLRMMRERYWKSLQREAPRAPEAAVFVDKNPSTTSSLHLFLRLFPELKVITALRDPRDTVISCFFQNLALTSANVNFLSLERTAIHYEDLMGIWLKLRELDAFEWIETRYEDMVANLETEGRRVTEFLGLDWQAGQLGFHEFARKKFVFAPTYSDVTKPVYTRAVNRWEHYAEFLAPIQERLAPFCQAFGYSC